MNGGAGSKISLLNTDCQTYDLVVNCPLKNLSDLCVKRVIAKANACVIFFDILNKFNRTIKRRKLCQAAPAH